MKLIRNYKITILTCGLSTILFTFIYVFNYTEMAFNTIVPLIFFFRPFFVIISSFFIILVFLFDRKNNDKPNLKILKKIGLYLSICFISYIISMIPTSLVNGYMNGCFSTLVYKTDIGTIKVTESLHDLKDKRFFETFKIDGKKYNYEDLLKYYDGDENIEEIYVLKGIVKLRTDFYGLDYVLIKVDNEFKFIQDDIADGKLLEVEKMKFIIKNDKYVESINKIAGRKIYGTIAKYFEKNNMILPFDFHIIEYENNIVSVHTSLASYLLNNNDIQMSTMTEMGFPKDWFSIKLNLNTMEIIEDDEFKYYTEIIKRFTPAYHYNKLEIFGRVKNDLFQDYYEKTNKYISTDLGYQNELSVDKQSKLNLYYILDDIGNEDVIMAVPID